MDVNAEGIRLRSHPSSFHANPDYAFWSGWSEVQRDLTGIKASADELRQIKVPEPPPQRNGDAIP
jgi:hypothetical protein